MKKLWIFLLTIVLVFSLIGCSKTAQKPVPKKQATSTVKKGKVITPGINTGTKTPISDNVNITNKTNTGTIASATKSNQSNIGIATKSNMPNIATATKTNVTNKVTKKAAKPKTAAVAKKTATKKTAPTKKINKLNITGFYDNEFGASDSYGSLVKGYKSLDVISPLWLSVEKDGSVKDSTSAKVIDFARSKKLKIIPLINVINSQDEVLTVPQVRDRAINEIVALVKKHNFDGINIDFEFIPKGQKDYIQDKDYLTDFVRRLRAKIKPLGKTLNMSVIPHYQVSPELSGIYDYHKLAPLVDVVTLMTYDNHFASSPPGPVSPLDWVNYNIQDAIKEGWKPSQICLGVATYGYNWPQGTPGGFSEPTKDIQAKAQAFGVKVNWSQTYHEPYYIYYDSTTGTNREIWFENSYTLAQKMNLAKSKGLHGICIWRLGFEAPDFWSVISKNK